MPKTAMVNYCFFTIVFSVKSTLAVPWYSTDGVRWYYYGILLYMMVLNDCYIYVPLYSKVTQKYYGRAPLKSRVPLFYSEDCVDY